MFYKVPIEDGHFIGVDYNDIIEGIATASLVEKGFGYIETNTEYPLETITWEEFVKERVN